jgi:UDP-3-O-[3-hydroxymyristoyl] N-acetylglucosamine deacetylase
MRVLPAAENSGVQFVRRDVPKGRNLVGAYWRNAVRMEHTVVLGNEHGVTVAAAGYLLSALKGCGVDNATIELDGPEVPAMDGSVATFVRMIAYVGRVQQRARRRAIRIEKPVSVNHGLGFAVLTPASSPRFTMATKACEPDGPSRRLTFDLNKGCFRSDLSWVRAPGFGHRAVYAAEGGSVAAARVIASMPEGPSLRSVDEQLRHAIVVSMGDLCLAGTRILGHYHGFDANHWMNHRLLWQVFRDAESWSSVRLDEPYDPPLVSNRRHRRSADA